MEISPGWCSNWYVSEDYLRGAMKDLDDYGVDFSTVFVVPSLKMKEYYLITWKNPPKK